jgi:hypothetical protein
LKSDSNGDRWTTKGFELWLTGVNNAIIKTKWDASLRWHDVFLLSFSGLVE